MRIFVRQIFFLCVVLFVGLVNAGSDRQNGTVGALELLIPPDASGAALGGNGVANMYGVNAIHWNPAGIALGGRFVEVLFSQLDYYADIHLNYVALRSSLSHFGNFAFGLKRLDFGDIPVTTEEAPDGTGGLFSPGYTTLSLTYAASLLDRLQMGFSFKYISESIATVQATGFAIDGGVQYQINRHLRLGIAMRNWGPDMRFNGAGLNRKVYLPGNLEDPISDPEALRIVAAKFEIPTVVDFGLSWNVWAYDNHRVTLTSTFQNQHQGWDRLGIGAIWEVQLSRGFVQLKSGFQAAYNPSHESFHIHDEQSVMGPAIGANIRMPFVSNMQFTFSYTYAWTEYFENIHWISFSLHLNR